MKTWSEHKPEGQKEAKWGGEKEGIWRWRRGRGLTPRSTGYISRCGVVEACTPSHHCLSALLFFSPLFISLKCSLLLAYFQWFPSHSICLSLLFLPFWSSSRIVLCFISVLAFLHMSFSSLPAFCCNTLIADVHRIDFALARDKRHLQKQFRCQAVCIFVLQLVCVDLLFAGFRC